MTHVSMNNQCQYSSKKFVIYWENWTNTKEIRESEQLHPQVPIKNGILKDPIQVSFAMFLFYYR